MIFEILTSLHFPGKKLQYRHRQFFNLMFHISWQTPLSESLVLPILAIALVLIFAALTKTVFNMLLSFKFFQSFL